MRTQIIDRTGNGTTQVYDLLFDALAVMVMPGDAAFVGYHMPTMWCARTNTWGARETVKAGVRILGRKLIIGADASVNANGVAYRLLVIGAESGDVEAPSWMGNATAGRAIKLTRAATPIYAAIKRDNALPPVVKVAGVNAMAMDGSTVTDSIALGSGSLTLTAADEVNQYVGSLTIGEGIDALVVHSDSGATVGSYTGTGAAQTIAVGASRAAVFVWRTDAPEVGVVFLPSGGGAVKAADALAPIAGAGSLSASNLSLSGTTANASGGTYSYLALPLNTPSSAVPAAPAIITSGRKAVSFAGRGAMGYVDCGTGLVHNNQITLEWLGHIPGEALVANNMDGWLLGKAASAQTNVAGSASWGLSTVNRIDEFGHDWAGQHATAICTGRVFYAAPISAASWRTGVIVPYGVHLHQFVYRADGTREYWLDGRLVKQRAISTDVLTSNAAHRVTMGARWTGSAYSNNSRMTILSARVYARALTLAELQTRQAKAMFGSSETDVTLNLAAAWEGSGLVGATWTDSVGSNHGTITGGTILDL